jgi:transmembrane protein EpsG
VTVYLCNIFLIIIEGLWLLCQNPSQQNKKIFCILASVQWILISGLRHISVGADTAQYMNNFERIKTYNWNYVLDFTRTQILIESDAKAPGYTFLEKVFQVFCSDYRIFLLCVAVLFFGTMGYSLYKNSENPALSYILFSCLFYSFFAITGTRQTIATAVVVFIGIELVKKRKLVPFVIVILLMSTVHKSVLCFLPFYWIARIKVNKKSVTVYWIFTIIAYIYRHRFLAILQTMIGYENYQENEGAGAGTFLYLLILVALFVTIFHPSIIENSNGFRRDDVVEIPMIQLSMNALFMAVVFSSLLLINQNAMRAVQYYSVFLMFLLPEIPNMFSTRRDEWLYNIMVVIVLIALFMNGNHVYYFFWQNVKL